MRYLRFEMIFDCNLLLISDVLVKEKKQVKYICYIKYCYICAFLRMFGNKKGRGFYVKLNGYGYKTLDILSEIPDEFCLVRYNYFAELCQTVT